MLSDLSIKKFIKSKDIIVEPFNLEDLDAARITLHLGPKILIPQKGVIDAKTNKLPKYKEVTLSTDKPFPLKPGMFVIGETEELIGLSEKVVMLMDGRSTIARLGISVVQASLMADPGQEPKKMTLEIYNCGPNTVMLYRKIRCVRGFFLELNPPASKRYDTKGRYITGDSHKPILRDEISK